MFAEDFEIRSSHGSIRVNDSGETHLTLTGLSKHKLPGSCMVKSPEALALMVIEGAFNRTQDRLGAKGLTENGAREIIHTVLTAMGNGTYGSRTRTADPVAAMMKTIATAAARKQGFKGDDVKLAVAEILVKHAETLRTRAEKALAADELDDLAI